MNFRHTLIVTGLLLVLLTALYTWNRTTGALDSLTTNAGLELTGVVLDPVRQLQAAVSDLWKGYVDLTDVREENRVLTERVRELEARLLSHSEDMAELVRLRELLKMPVDVSWVAVGARVLSGRLGPNSQLEAFTINRGYTSGAAPGTPIVTNQGLLGRVLRASPHTATAILLTHTMSRIAIFTQKSRTPGILAGTGPGRPLEVRYMDGSTTAEPGEILVTSGLDGKYPKGIPVARVVSVTPSNYSEFMTVRAEPLADLRHIEEVLLLEPTGVVHPPEPASPVPELAGPPLPDALESRLQGAGSGGQNAAQGRAGAASANAGAGTPSRQAATGGGTLAP